MENNPLIEELPWQAYYAEILAVNPALAEIIHTLQLPQEYTLFKVRYPYGAKVIERGELQLPMANGRLLPLSHARIPATLREKLGYRFMPLGLILTKMAEIYFSEKKRIIPERLYKRGDVVGLWSLFDPPENDYAKNILNFSAGARTIFMLPMISDNVSHARIKRELSIHSYAPKTLLDHHELFTEIVKQRGGMESWTCEILFFCKKWVDHANTQLMLLRNYCLERAWQHTYYCRHQMVLDVAQEAFSEAISRRNLKTKPYIINTFNHLINIGRGIAPGFVAAGLCEEAAPIRVLQDAYVNHYLLKDYAPIIMYPHHLDVDANASHSKVYYSLSLPTLLNYGPRPGRMPSIMADLRELKLLFDFANEYYDNSAVDYKLFHTEPDQFGEVCHSQILPQLDQNLLIYPNSYQKRSFPYTSAFFRGCIQIARRDVH
jgi:hypothetical protein